MVISLEWKWDGKRRVPALSPLTNISDLFVCACVCVSSSVCGELKSYFCRAAAAVMWEGRLSPIGLELLAAAFLPLLSGGWRGIICQRAGSHCFWVGTNAASIRQLKEAVHMQHVWLHFKVYVLHKIPFIFVVLVCPYLGMNFSPLMLMFRAVISLPAHTGHRFPA